MNPCSFFRSKIQDKKVKITTLDEVQHYVRVKNDLLSQEIFIQASKSKWTAEKQLQVYRLASTIFFCKQLE